MTQQKRKCVIAGCQNEVPQDGLTCCREHSPKAWEEYGGGGEK
ncbi:MAG: hypothetical protein QXQ64_02420 [Candidatus Bathyarchaeia archaeon]